MCAGLEGLGVVIFGGDQGSVRTCLVDDNQTLKNERTRSQHAAPLRVYVKRVSGNTV